MYDVVLKKKKLYNKPYTTTQKKEKREKKKIKINKYITLIMTKQEIEKKHVNFY